MKKLRADVKKEDKWDVEALFSNWDAWQAAFAPLKERGFTALLKEKGHLKTRLKQALDLYFDLSRELDKFYTYAHLRHDENITDEEAKQRFHEVMQFYHDFRRESAWMEPEILQLDRSIADEAGLKEYRLYLERVFLMAPHTLSEKEENLLALAGKPLGTAYKVFSALNNADFTFDAAKDSEGKSHPVSHASYLLYLQSPDRQLRKETFESIHREFKKHENGMAELIQGTMDAHVFYSKARGYSSCLEAALFPHQIDQEVYRALIEGARKSSDALSRYLEVRKGILGLDELHPYDLHVPCVPNVDFRFTFEEACDIVIEAVAPLGEEYQRILAKGLKEERWTDRYENKGKRSGAYSSGCYDSRPYILMNFSGTLNDLMTLAHEAGHSMHSLYTHREQPYPYSSYSIFVAEVASTFNEELVFRYLVERAKTPEEKYFLINQKIDGMRATFFRQALFAEFELRLHEMVEQGAALTPGALKGLYRELNEFYYKGVVLDEAIDVECMRIPHFYYNFYVYQYATGISAALALVERVLEQGGREDYLNFLSSGCSDYPVELLQKAGVDMRTSAPVDCLIERFRSLTEELAVNCPSRL